MMVGTSFDERMRRPVRARAVAVVAAALIAGLLVATALGGGQVCSGGLSVVDEPAGWRAFPLAADRDHFRFSSTAVTTKYHAFHRDAFFYDRRLCPRAAGAPLDAWFAQGRFPGDSRDPSQLVLHRDPASDVYVVGGTGKTWTRPHTAAEEGEELVVAFRRSIGARFAWTADRWAVLAMVEALAVLACVIAVVDASRKLARARALTSGEGFVDGTLDASRALVVDGQRIDHASTLQPGAVLVRFTPASEPSYREPAVRTAAEVVAASLPSDLASHAHAALRYAVVVSTVAVALAWLVTLLVAMTDSWGEMY